MHRLIAIVLLVLGLVGTANAEEKERWSPPAGTVWKMASGNCELSPEAQAGKIFPLLKGCYFGPADGNAMGIAFFRVCGGFRESQPFMVADFTRNVAVFYARLDGAPYDETPLEEGDIDPMPFFRRINEWQDSCWVPDSTEL